MTPTDIEAVLPYVPAGISSGDLTDREDRWAFAERLMLLYTAAGTHRAPNDIRHGDTWEVRDGRAVIVAPNDWGPPRKGTHESDLGVCAPFLDDIERPDGYLVASDWSRTPDNDEGDR